MKNSVPLLLEGYKDGETGLSELEQLCRVYTSVSSEKIYRLLLQEKNKCLDCNFRSDTGEFEQCGQCRRNPELKDFYKPTEETR